MTLDSRGPTLDRFHRVLIDEIRSRRPAYLSDPFTVAEIYQHLMPYASHRDRLGVEINGDYEDALLRLLAGEGDYLKLESEHARERLRNELSSPNPDTTLYREFAAVDVRLNPDRIPPEADGGGSPPSAGDAADEDRDDVPVDSLAPEGARAEASPAPAAPNRPEPGRVSESDAGTCSWCRAELPNRENLNYCPFCGTDVNVVPCPSCGEALESGWRFCIACGAGVAEG